MFEIKVTVDAEFSKAISALATAISEFQVKAQRVGDLAVVNAGVDGSPATATTRGRKKTSRKKKAEEPAAETPAPPTAEPQAEAPAAAPQPEPEAPANPPEQPVQSEEPAEVTRDDVSARLLAFRNNVSHEAAVAILQKFNAGSLAALKAEDYAAVIAAIDEAEAAA